MKVRITADKFILPKGTVLEIGDAERRVWDGNFEPAPADPLDHDDDGRKGGVVWQKKDK